MIHDLTLHVLTDESLDARELVRIVDAAVSSGATVVQLRAKRASAREQLDQAISLSRVIDGRARFVIDDRLDVALAAREAGAHVDGVHLGQSDVPPTVARHLLGADALIGWTANTPEHFAAAAAFPAGTLDYLGVGVIHPTNTKPDHPMPLGVVGFGELVQQTALPCVAIGGIGVADAGRLRRAGAAGIAVVSAICAASDPGAATRAFQTAFDSTEA